MWEAMSGNIGKQKKKKREREIFSGDILQSVHGEKSQMLWGIGPPGQSLSRVNYMGVVII